MVRLISKFTLWWIRFLQKALQATITGTLPRQSPPCPSYHYRRVHRPALPVRLETDASPSLLDGGPSARGVLADPPFVAGCTPISHKGSTVCESAGDWDQRGWWHPHRCRPPA